MTDKRGPEVPFPLKALGEIFELLTSARSRGPGMFPIPGLPQQAASGSDGGVHPQAPAGYTEDLGRAKYEAHRVGDQLFIKAEGMLPNWNQRADIRQSSRLIQPPQFDLLFYTPQFTSPALRQFSFVEQFGFPADAERVVINDADGQHVIDIAESAATSGGLSFLSTAGDAGTATMKTGYGKSLQEAFANAVAQLPDRGPIADGFSIYHVREAGMYRGGIAGVTSHFCKVEVTSSTSSP